MKLLYTVITVFLCSVLWSQKATLQLKVIDEYENPMPYALVEIYDQTDQLVNGGATDDNGNMSITKVPFGTYKLYIEVATYKSIEQDIEVSKKNQDLGVFQMSLNKELKEVVVRAEESKYQLDIDKRVIEVGQDLVSAGASASDVLNNVPSVNVDQQSGELSLRGNANVKVFVDGRPSNIPTADLLRQLPSNSIKSIEIITNPSAKYDPDGNSGIINIITYKEKRKGYNIVFNSGLTRGRRTRANASVNSNINFGNTNIFANYSGNWGENYFFSNVENETTGIDQFFSIDSKRPSNLVKFGFDFFIDDMTALTIYTNQNFSDTGGEWNYEFYENNETYLNNNDETAKYHNQDYSFNFQRNIKRDDHYIEIDGIFSTSNRQSDRGYYTTFPLVEVNPQSYNEHRDSDQNNARLNFDYFNVIKEKTTVEGGFQFRREGVKNYFNSGQKISNPNLINEIYSPNITYDFRRYIYSSYLNLKRKFGNWGTQIGLRYEYVEENADNYYNDFDQDEIYAPYKNNYNALYPSAFLSYTINEKNTLSLNYSRRIDRPSVYQLSPVAEWNSGLFRSTGNPDLRPQFTNSIELGYLRKVKAGSIGANVFYRSIEDNISRFIIIDPEVPNGAILQYANYDTTEAYGVETNFYLKLKPWWSLNGGLDYFSNQVTFGELERRSSPFNARISQDFKVSKSIKIQNFFMYRGVNVLAQGEMQPMWRMDLGANYRFAKNKANLTLRVSDIFQTFYAGVKVEEPYKSEGEFKWEAQTIYLGFNYTLGGKVQNRANKQQNTNNNQGGGVGF